MFTFKHNGQTQQNQEVWRHISKVIKNTVLQTKATNCAQKNILFIM